MTTRDVVYSLRIFIDQNAEPEQGFELGSTAGESSMLTARLHILYKFNYKCLINEIDRHILIISKSLSSIRLSISTKKFPIDIDPTTEEPIEEQTTIAEIGKLN